MTINRALRAVAAGSLAVIAATSVAACSSASSAGEAPANGASREASAYRASHLCVLNDTGKSILSVGEYEMTRVDVTHPDPTGPLAPGETWCTDGYNALKNEAGSTWDASVEVRFSDTPQDFARFLVRNAALDVPTMWCGQENRAILWTPGFFADWEIDLTLPAQRLGDPQLTGPRHDFHLRRLDDTPNFKEWLVTVRS